MPRDFKDFGLGSSLRTTPFSTLAINPHLLKHISQAENMLRAVSFGLVLLVCVFAFWTWPVVRYGSELTLSPIDNHEIGKADKGSALLPRCLRIPRFFAQL